MSKLSLKGWIGVLLGKAAQTGIPAHAKAKGWHSGWGGGGGVGWNTGAREGIGIFLSLPATPVVPLCTLTLEGRARVLGLG